MIELTRIIILDHKDTKLKSVVVARRFDSKGQMEEHRKRIKQVMEKRMKRNIEVEFNYTIYESGD